MGTHKGNAGKVKIGSDLVAEVTGFSIKESAAIIDDSSIGDDWDTHLVGSKNWSASVDCWWDETDTDGQGALVAGAAVTLNLYSEGDGTGASYFTGTATVNDWSHEVKRNSTVSCTIQLTGNGALTRSTVSA